MFRNGELKKELGLFLLLAILLGAGLCFVSPLAGGIGLLGGLAFCGLYLYFARKRYTAMGALSRELDEILHGQKQLYIDESQEGELSILTSQIGKMTRRLKEQADSLQAEKSFLSRSMADISHQLRTPLTSLHLTVSMLGREDLPEERRLALLREVKLSLNRMEWLIDTLLKMAKLEADTIPLAREPVPVNMLVAKASAPLLIPMELRGIRFHTDCGTETFLGDLRWSSEALGNVLKNCMEHTPDGGDIWVTGRKTALFTEITVRDSGSGFLEEDIPHLFERFYRGQNAGEGSIGIGLALARMVMSRQEGTISAANAPAGGALFTLRFYESVV